MNANHTPGPWAIDRSAHFKTFQICGPMFGPDSNGGYAVAEIAYAGTHAEANAHLIAAAPELLAALKEAEIVLAVALSWPGSEGTRSKMRAAIAKAEGRE